jgi:GntR family transcriptional repressor for pyruvate dehydrogenase complex
LEPVLHDSTKPRPAFSQFCPVLAWRLSLMTDSNVRALPPESVEPEPSAAADPWRPQIRHGADSGLPALKVPVTHFAAERIQKLIVEGAWREGERLPGERQLADQLSVSRVSLRHALSLLETLGFIAIEPGRGAFVQPADRRRSQPRAKLAGAYQADEVFLLRCMLNGWAAALLAPRITASQVHSLAGAVAEMREAAQRRDAAQLSEWDMRFHDLLFQLCGNKLLADLVQTIQKERGDSGRMAYVDEESMLRPVTEHQAVVDALAAHDAAGAKQAVQQHLRNAAQRAGIDLGPLLQALSPDAVEAV